MKKNIFLVSLVIAALLLAGCGGTAEKKQNQVTVGGKNFTEQDILVYMMKYMLEGNTNLKVETKAFLGGTNIVAQALDRGDIDLYVEYTGTALINLLGQPVINDSQAAYDKVRSIYKEKKRLEWLQPLGFNNTYTLTMRSDEASRLGIQKISDLAGKTETLSLGCTAEFLERPDGIKGLENKYGFKFNKTSSMDPGLTYAAVRDKKVDVIDGFATDGRIPAFNLLVLKDDRQFFPPYFAAPVIREDTLKKHPEIATVLNRLAGKLTDKEMARLNAQVDLEKKDPKTVAKDWLQAKGFIK